MAAMRMSTADPSSYSEPDKCCVKSVALDWTIDFETHQISGTAQLHLERKIEKLDSVVLDVRDLSIVSAALDGTNENLPLEVSNPAGVSFGQKLTIQLKVPVEKSFSITIKYATSTNASALDWLNSQQTAGKRHPYVYSQCQAIHARSLYPCQDTPRVKFPYTAKVRAPKALTVLMSAERLGVEEDSSNPGLSITSFSMKVPIPSYLLAIVAGDLESRQIGPRSKLWSEKEFVEEAAYEFAETESMLATAEELMGPYVWGHYDLLVLPPSFPYGGMENPCLTFVTPTLLAGDRSLADVIAHEISHSWTGNLVTNNTFEHFWLNEGHTMYVERRILGRLHGEPYRQVHAAEGWRHLNDTVKTLTESNQVPYTRLVPDLTGVDPDDAFSAVPYEKGFALLYYLETLLGGPKVFGEFLRAYIERFKYQSIDSEDWKAFLYEHFRDQQATLNTVDWNTWFFGTGLPPYQPNYDMTLAQPSYDLCARWRAQDDDNLDQFSAVDIQNWPSFQIKEFVSQLKDGEPLSLQKVQALEEKYSLNAIRNAEIRLVWYGLCIKAKWPAILPRALEFVSEQGRMKFVRPLYREMGAWEEARPQAIENFLAHRDEMHSTSATHVAKDLHLE